MTQETTQGWIARLRAAGAELVKNGSPIGRYFTLIDETAMATRRDTKDHLASRLRASSEAPQIVTVQGRSGEKSRAYVIIPLDKVTETLEANLPDEDAFVPITASVGIGSIMIPSASNRRYPRI